MYDGGVEEVGIRELNQQTSKVLRRVRATGESVTVTEHGRRIATIVPAASGRYQDLVDTGQVEVGRRDIQRVERVRIDRPSAEVLAEVNEDQL